jgi:hypothetical protein
VTQVPKFRPRPSITDRALINLILKSPELTRAFGAKSMLAWDFIEKESDDPSSKISAPLVLTLK